MVAIPSSYLVSLKSEVGTRASIQRKSTKMACYAPDLSEVRRTTGTRNFLLPFKSFQEII